ncbi:hypothetical protein [Nocardioides alcanivorans]|uniref:hypothetical protein n=1 Tax=Nocardioides alcanivorans TaxID=2897352 RepID=UPI001F429F3E|nr:hypothetical protein [Nocardioides alcanivorans]
MKLSVRRLLAATTAVAVASTGTLAMASTVNAAPDDSAKVVAAKKKANKAKYGMSGNAYGTLITAGLLGVRSDKTSHSWVGCTARNKAMNSSLVGADVLPGSTFLDVGVVRTQTLARKGKKAVQAGFPKGTKAGTIATSKVADVKLAGLGPLNLKLTGLSSEARAWVNKNGQFQTKHGYNILDLQANTGIPALDDLLNNTNSPLKTLIDLLLDGVVKGVVIDQVVNGVLKIAGLGEIRLGKSYGIKKKKQAWSNAVVLEVRLYGADGKKSNDDITVKLGHSRARVVKGLEKGKFNGYASGLNGKLLDGVLQTARLAHQPLPCTGTAGKWTKEAVAGVDLLGLGFVKVDGVSTGVLGKPGKKKAGKAGSRSTTARVELGGPNGLVVSAITSKAIAKRNKAGKLKRNTKVNLGDIYLGGNRISLHQLLNPVINGLDGLLSQLGIASVKTGVVRKSKNGVGVIAVQIKLLDGKGADIKIGDVEARVVK